MRNLEVKLNLEIKVKPVAFESLGVRSMCTFIETPDANILIDPGVSLGKRFGLLPHPKEYRVLKKMRRNLIELANKADLLIISHYHFDHYSPLNYTDYTWTWSKPEDNALIYLGKILLVKDYRDNINFSQRKRGWIFNKLVKDLASRIEIADGKTFKFGETIIRFSMPVWHGEINTPLGWVLMTTIEYKRSKVMFTSDVQGPIDNNVLNLILMEKPDLLIIGGPPTYLSNGRVNVNSISRAFENLVKLVKFIPNIILDHHLLRDVNWRNYVRNVFRRAEEIGHNIFTAAEFLGKRNRLLEGRRRELYEKYPPSEKFIEWTKMKKDERKKKPPPLRG